MFKPDPAEIARIKRDVERTVSGDQLRDNHFYQRLFSRTDGVFADVRKPAEWIKDGKEWIRVRKRLRRREWIEKFFPIRTKGGAITLLKMNPTQRMLEAQILRMERLRIPARVMTLKSRQQGISTYSQAYMFEGVLRGRHQRGLIVADNKDRSETLLAIAQVARSEMVKDSANGDRWDFRLTSKARDTFRFGEPIMGEVEVTTAEAPAPGRGGTRSMLHLSESAHFKKPDQTYGSCMASLPTLPGTLGIDETTANGARGRFYHDFWKSWNEHGVPLLSRTQPWVAMFFAFWQHPEYFWTRSYGSGRELPAQLVEDIQNSLTVEEDWLLKQEYIRRWEPDDEWIRVRAADYMTLIIEGKGPTAKIVGTKRVHADTWKWRRKGVGWQKVSYDQLAWRRSKIEDKDFGGDLDLFNQEMPSRPRVAFLSSGRSVFDQDLITRMMSAAKDKPPLFRGTLRKALERA